MTGQTEGRRRRWRLPAILVTTIALLLGSAATAFALVSPSPNTNTIGAAGYDVTRRASPATRKSSTPTSTA